MKKTLHLGLAFAFLACGAFAKPAVFFVGAHPDDSEGFAGTAFLLREKYDIHIVDLTRGELGLGEAGLIDGSTARTRMAEEAAACAYLGATPHFLGEVDGSAYAGKPSVDELVRLIRELKPVAIFTHWPVDSHCDHVQTAAVTRRAVREAPFRGEYYFYEVLRCQTRQFPVVYSVDISSTIDKKVEMLRRYACQNENDELAKEKRDQAAWRGARRRPAVPYAEVFATYDGKPCRKGILQALKETAVAPAKKPGTGLIGLTESHRDGEVTSVAAFYAEAFAKAGRATVVIPCTTNAAVIEATLENLDCLVVTGGADVEPARYGQERHEGCARVDPLRDAYEFALVAAARKRNLPIVGICRGEQLLNVAFGGTLWQDIPSEFPRTTKVSHQKGKYESSSGTPVAHTVRIEPGTRLAALIGTEELAVNSHHHQAVRDLAPGFRVAARAPDGVIEAIESTTYPAIGVQFHPETIVARGEGHPVFDLPRMLKLLDGMTNGKAK